jgi:hypothetical protein
MSNDKQKTAWHFVAFNRQLGYNDGRTAVPGLTYYDDNRSNGQVCRPGLLHWSYRVIDALMYAPGPILCEVLPGGEIFTGTFIKDKCGSTQRTVIRMANVSTVLHEAACQFAERALNRTETPDLRDLRHAAAIRANRDWLAGRISYAELACAQSEAGVPARFASWSAARFAAESGVESAALAVERLAAESAAESAAAITTVPAWTVDWTAEEYAERATAYRKERTAQNRILMRLLEDVEWET